MLQGDRVILAKAYSKMELGVYSVALSLAMVVPTMIAGGLSQVLLPFLAKLQGDMVQFERKLHICAMVVSLITALTACGIVILGPTFIEIIYSTNIKEIKGSNTVEKIALDKPYDQEDELKVQGVFIEIGSEPGVELSKQLGVKIDDDGFIIVGNDQGTNVAGIWAAGDCTNTLYHQNNIAAGDAVKALEDIYLELQRMK